jgi:16S rRNA (adenine1518-N6/adenine1519-N6)-dimethyltransferase
MHLNISGPYGINNLNALIEYTQIRPNKLFGQNFLFEENSARALVDFTGISAKDTVLEIGCGFGSLTLVLAEKAKNVIAVELDNRIVNTLKNVSYIPDNVSIVNEDFLKTNIDTIFKRHGKIKIVGNLPYKSSSQIFLKILADSNLIEEATLTFQEELADRITSGPSCKDYGSLSVLAALYSIAEKGPSIGPASFYPKPKISSRVTKFLFSGSPIADLKMIEKFSRFLQSVFSYRRKNILNTLKLALKDRPTEDILSVLAGQGIDKNQRIEKLPPIQIYTLYTDLIA